MNMKKMGMIRRILLGLSAAVIVAGTVLFTGNEAQAAKASSYAAVFNASWYAAHHPDVTAVYGTDPSSLLSHFIAYGMDEGRQASEEFNVDAYGARYEDLRNAFGTNKKLYYMHYINYGKKEGRIATLSGQPVSGAAQQTVQVQQTAPATQQPAQTSSRKPENWRAIPGTSAPGYEQAAAILDTLDWSVTKAFNWCAGLPYYGHGKKDMPETGDPGVNWFADYGFTNRKGNCFVMASCFFQFARLCGYSPRQMVGMVPSRKGGLTIHSWVEIDVDGQTYVYDPDFQMGTGKNGFKIQYGQKGTWRYQQYTQMSE
ncbi:MAG: transglutaminase domain-containing protein [Lachnospiraceae bacterium]|nr:transglutaminase domain-containing protein [Lachnospiraceae bacterium]